ncbi:hypothetical protein SAMN05192553_101287 [Cyclobacterium xiamenense]|uniref:DUF3575 domain-containing protein n=1 Tax=Cyclobacterium xiamenense TaxID=1297121 RepID=A0A1H6TER2_9BACT|nr:hypothetical protein [Cyclobacterium xiamenense]SEI78603.1 hypothetical protein SAMN05192553_101287 [Cyclobacterium xiamenense]
MGKIIVLLFLFVSQIAYSQDNLSFNSDSRHIEYTTKERFPAFSAGKSTKMTSVKSVLGLQAGIAEPLLGLFYERLFSAKLAGEVAVGLIGLSIGPKLYFAPARAGKLNGYIGLIGGAGYFSEGSYGYLPIGISRLWKNNILVSFDIGPHTGNVFSDGEVIPAARFKIGKAF